MPSHSAQPIVKGSDLESQHRDEGRVVTGGAGFWRRPLLNRALVGTVVSYVSIATFPGGFLPIGPGLDLSWVYAINRLPYTEFVFGRDVVFSYGPLGYLLVPADIGSNMAQAAVMWVLMQGTLVALILYHYRRHRSVAGVVSFAVAYVLAVSVDLPNENRLLILLGLLLSIPPEDRRVWRVTAPASAALAGLLLFMKLNVGIAALFMLVAWVSLMLLRRMARLPEILAAVGAVCVGTIILLGVALASGVTGLVRWLRLGLSLTSGFAESMSAVQAPEVVALVGLAVGAFVALVALNRSHAQFTLLALPLLVPILFAFRHSFARHGKQVFGVVLASLAVAMLGAGDRRKLVQGSVAFVAAVVLVGIATMQTDCNCEWSPRALSPARGWSNLISVVDLPAVRQDLSDESDTLLPADRLPPDWVAAMRDASGGVDTIPTQIEFIPANNLPWNPNPVLQTYLAYTPLLDRRAADHLPGWADQDTCSSTSLTWTIDIQCSEHRRCGGRSCARTSRPARKPRWGLTGKSVS